MRKLKDISATGQALISATLRDLDGENLKCRNMLSLTGMILDKEVEDEDLSTALAVLLRYWSMRLSTLGQIKVCLDLLGLEGEEVDRFLRHNYLNDLSLKVPGEGIEDESIIEDIEAAIDLSSLDGVSA